MKSTNICKTLRSFVGYSWAIILTLCCPIIFLGMDTWSNGVSQLPFMKIHPRYSGGQVSHELIDTSATWTIHEPVFDGLFSNRKEGSLQIVCKLKEITPLSINKAFDYDRDGITDFELKIQLNEPSQINIIPISPEIKQLKQWTHIQKGFLIRIELINDPNLAQE